MPPGGGGPWPLWSTHPTPGVPRPSPQGHGAIRDSDEGEAYLSPHVVCSAVFQMQEDPDLLDSVCPPSPEGHHPVSCREYRPGVTGETLSQRSKAAPNAALPPPRPHCSPGRPPALSKQGGVTPGCELTIWEPMPTQPLGSVRSGNVTWPLASVSSTTDRVHR